MIFLILRLITYNIYGNIFYKNTKDTRNDILNHRNFINELNEFAHWKDMILLK